MGCGWRAWGSMTGSGPAGAAAPPAGGTGAGGGRGGGAFPPGPIIRM